MYIEHIALWTDQLDTLVSFYETYFGAAAHPKYTNPKTHFESVFVTFDSGARIEIMHKPALGARPTGAQPLGYAHLAFSVGSREGVDRLTQRLAADGHPVIGWPRVTGDGYYESLILDPEGNLIEITV